MIENRKSLQGKDPQTILDLILEYRKMKIYHCFYFLYFSMTQKPIVAQNSVPGITCDVNNDETLSFSKIICSFMCRRQSHV